MRGSALLPAAILLALAIDSARAAGDKPAIEIKTRAAAITVAIEQPLKAYPGVAADLLAEGQRYIAKARAAADAEYKTDRDWFKQDDGHRWSYDLVYSFRSLVADRYVSIMRDDGTFTGGAHPNTRTDTILWDITAKKRVSIRPFFSEILDNGPTLTALAILVRQMVGAEKRERWKDSRPDDEKQEPLQPLDEAIAKDEQLKNTIQPKLLKIGPISLAPSTAKSKSSGLTFHFSPYDVEAYAAGPYVVFVPWGAFKPFLSAEGAAIFGGERPAKDKEAFDITR